MKKLMTGLLILVAAGVAYGGVMFMTAGMVDTADGFFQAVKRQDLPKARSFLAQATSRKLDDGALKKLMEADTLTRYKGAHFPNRRVSGDRGEMSGTLTTTSGGVVPVKVVLVKEGGVWKMHGFQTGK